MTKCHWKNGADRLRVATNLQFVKNAASFLVLFFLFLKKVIEMSDIARHSEYMSRRKSVESQ